MSDKLPIRAQLKRFRQQGSVSDLPHTGRQVSVRKAENVALVEDSIAENPDTSIQRRATQIRMSRRSLPKLLRELHLFPYKIQVVQALQPTDLQSRLAYAVHIQQLAREQNEFIHKLIMSDEAHFQLNGFLNKQNCRIWAFENPKIVHQRELHPIKCTVWCGFISERVIGPYFFKDEEGVTVTITVNRFTRRSIVL